MLKIEFCYTTDGLFYAIYLNGSMVRDRNIKLHSLKELNDWLMDLELPFVLGMLPNSYDPARLERLIRGYNHPDVTITYNDMMDVS